MAVFSKANVLVVGGAGFVGTNLVRLLLKGDVKEIFVIDNLLSSERTSIPHDHRVRFIEGSIADDKILTHVEDKFDYVFHLATFHGNQSSIFDPIADHQNNTLTTLKLFNHLKNFHTLKKVVYSSAGCSVAAKTFDAPDATSEDAPICIDHDSPYSISKVIGEFYSVYFHKQHGLPTVRARFQNVYGPWEILGAGKWRGTPATVWRNVVSVFIYKALKGQSLPVENKGIATRDFIFVEDICRGLAACAESGSEGDVYNIATGAEIRIMDLANKINTLTGNSAPTDFRPRRGWDNSGRRFGSTEKAEKELGFEAIVGIDEGLSITIEWTKNNLELISANIEKHKDKMQEYRKLSGMPL